MGASGEGPADSAEEFADAAMPVGAPIHRQYLDRTTTTSVITLGYRPTRTLVRRVYGIGAGMALVAMVAAIPALMFLPFGEHPMGITSAPRLPSVRGPTL